MTARDKVYKFDIELFPGDLWVVFSEKGFRAALKELQVETDLIYRGYGSTVGLTSSVLGRKRLVSIHIDAHENAWAAGYKERIDRTVVHEAMHVVQDIANHISTVFDMETEAYLLEHIYGIIWHAYSEATKNDKAHNRKLKRSF